VICLVTDRGRFAREPEEELVLQVRAAAAAGVHLVQVRERELATRDLLHLVGRCVEAARGTSTRVLVNDRVDVALAAGAHGVHLPANGLPPSRLRRLVPPGFIVGRSVHDADEAARVAADGGVDYLIFGTVFPTSSKPGAAAVGVVALRAAVAAAPVPVLAIGGVTLDRLSGIAATGAAGFAAIGLFAVAGPDSVARLQVVVRQASLAFDTPSGVP
jgi:thiamine-phosphate pyrophosphorylase